MAQNSNYGVPFNHKDTGDQIGYGSQIQHSSDQAGNTNQVPYFQSNTHQLIEQNTPNMYGYINTQQHPPASSWNWHTQQQPLQQQLPSQQPHQQSHIQHYSYQGNVSDDPWNWGWDEPKDQNTHTPQQINSNADFVWNWSFEGYEASHGQYSVQNNNVNTNVSNELNPAGTNSASNQHFYPQFENNSNSDSQYMGDSVSSLSSNLASQLTIDDTFPRDLSKIQKYVDQSVRTEEQNVDSEAALEADKLSQDATYMHSDDNLSDKSKLALDVSEDIPSESVNTTTANATQSIFEQPEIDHDGENMKKDSSDLNQSVSAKIQDNTDYDQCVTGAVNSTETTHCDVENIEIVPPEVHKDSWPSVSNADGNIQNMNSLPNINGSIPRQSHKLQSSTVHMDTSNLFGNNETKAANNKLRGSAVQPDDSANLETLPDNKERPDLVDYQMSPKLKPTTTANLRNKFVQDVGQRGLQQQMYSASPENLEIAPRCGPDRNQYLETGQLSEDVNPLLGFHRMIPGQTEGSALIPPPGLHRMVQGEGEPVGAEIPPPGLKRMIPGESSSPESGGTFSAPVDPMEPRVVTGVDQDDESASQMPSPPLPISDGDLPLDLTSQTTNSIPEPFSERSETIGSDNVDDYIPSSVESTAREQSVGHREDSLKDIDRRSIEIGNTSWRDTSTKDTDLHGMESPQRDERMYYNQSPSWSRDDRVWRNADEIDNCPKRGQRTNSRDYRRYNEQPEDELSVDDYKRHGDRNSEQFSDNARKDRLDTYDLPSHKKSHRERPRPQHDVRQVRSRDRHVNRNGRSDDRRRHYEYGMDNEYGRDDYYSRYYSHDMNSLDSQRSQPTSRPDSRPEFDYHSMRRDYRSYEAFPPYGVQGMDPHQYGSFYKFLMNMREKNPAAYADWYRNYISQQNHFQMASYPDERGSVHSGRSSVNEDRHRQSAYQHGFYRPPAYYPDYDARRFNSGQYYDHSRRSSQSGDLEPKSSFDDHIPPSPVNVTGINSPGRLTPVKFPATHVKGLWAIGGKLLNVLSNNPIENQPASIEIYDCRPLFDFDELRDYPGPLIKGVTHKKSVIAFCLNKIKSIEDDPTVVDKTSVILIWKFFVLLLTQNGALVGTDIADLLLSFTSETSHAHIFSPYQASNIESDSVKLSVEEVTNKFRDLLLLGNKKEALAWAVKHGLWGHALFLSSKIGKKMHMEVMMAFANRIPMNDPLQTLYQHLSGRVPAAVTCCADEKWGDWKAHLAMMIANSQDGICEQDCRAYITLGDTLATKGLLHASHFCYLMGQQEFGAYSDKGTKIALIGATHTKTFQELSTNEAIQMTEIYEYACQLGDPSFTVNHLMVYKLLYAMRLAECGMFDVSLSYLEAVSKSVLTQRKPVPRAVIKEVYQLAEILLNSDQVMSTTEGDDSEPNNPIWLQRMRDLYSQCYDLTWMENSPEIRLTNNQEETEIFPKGPNQMSTPQKSFYGNEVPELGGNYLNPNPYDESENSGFENIPTYMEGPSMEINQTDYWTMNSPNSMMTTSEESHIWAKNTQEADVQEVPQSWEPSIPEAEESLEARSTTPDTTKPKKEEVKHSDTSSRSWFGNILSKLSFVPKNQMKLPDDRNPSIVWNPEKNRWTNVDGSDDDAGTDIPPPPKASAPAFQGEASTNKFKMAKMRSARANYVDVFATAAKRTSVEDISSSTSNQLLGDQKSSRNAGSSNLLDVSQTGEAIRNIPFDTKNIFVPSNIETPDHGTFPVAKANGSTMAPQVEEPASIPAIPMYSTQKQNAPSGMQTFQPSSKTGSRLTARHKMMASEQKQYSVNQQQHNQEPGNSFLQPQNQKFNQYF